VVVGAEAALPAGEVMADPRPLELQSRDGLEVARDERERELRRPAGERLEQLDDPRREAGREVGGAELGVGRHRALGDLGGARVDVRRRDARGEQQVARDREVRAARRLDLVRVQVRDAVDLLGRLDDRLRVLDRRTLQQRAVDVEQQQERAGLAQRRKSVSGARAWAKAASSRAVLCTSSSSTISTGECM
jgi:hypothetical protein